MRIRLALFATVMALCASMAGAQVYQFPNLQNLGSAGWTFNIQAGGGSGAWNIASPSLSGNAMSLTSTGSYGAVQMFTQLSCASFPGASCNAITTVTAQVSVYIPSGTPTPQALEGPNVVLYDGAYQEYPSVQCASSAGNGMWNLWDGATSSWVSSGHACTGFNTVTNVWHTVSVIYGLNATAHTMTYLGLTFDGNTIFANGTTTYGGEVDASGGSLKAQMQLGNNAAGSSMTAYYDDYSVTAISGSSIVVTPTNPVIQAAPHKLGLNAFSGTDYFGDYAYKNYWANGSNVGFEPVRAAWIGAFTATQTSATQFSDIGFYSTLDANFWVGDANNACILFSQNADGNAGACRTVSASTATAGATGSYTLASGFPVTPQAGDIIEVSNNILPTPVAQCSGTANQPNNCNWTSVSNGGAVYGEDTDLASDGGQQALVLDTTAGSSATATESVGLDTQNWNMGVLFSTNKTITFEAKIASGTSPITANCPTRAAATNGVTWVQSSWPETLTSTWTKYTINCVIATPEVDFASGNPSCVAGGTTTACTVMVPGNNYDLNTDFSIAGSSKVYLDNLSLTDTAAGDPANTTIFSDNFVHALQNYCGTAPATGQGCSIRWWAGNQQNASTFAMLSADGNFAHQPGMSGDAINYGEAGQVDYDLPNYLALCKLVGCVPYIEVPMLFHPPSVSSPDDYTLLIQYLGGASTTTGGAVRAAQGQSAPWTTIFPVIHLSIGNENWNSGEFGQGLPYRAGTPGSDPIYDYRIFAAAAISAMHAASGYSAGSFDIAVNSQNTSYPAYVTELAQTGADTQEVNGYTMIQTSSASLSTLDYNQEAEIYNQVANAGDDTSLYQAVHQIQSTTDCGASGTATCKANIYEISSSPTGCSTDATPTCPTQATEDAFSAGGYQGVIDSLQMALLQHTYGMQAINYFDISGYQNGGPNGTTMKLWGNTLDLRDNNSPRGRPQWYGNELANFAVIGPEVSCPITNQPSYSYAGSSDTGVSPPIPAQNPEPYLLALCYKSGSQYAVALWNINQASSYTVNLSGALAPTGTVTEKYFQPAAIGTLNEAPSGSDSTLVAPATTIQSATCSSCTSFTIPAGSQMTLLYGGSVTAAPQLSGHVVISGGVTVQ